MLDIPQRTQLHRSRLRLFIILSALLFTSLACINIEQTFSITSINPNKAEVYLKHEQYLTDTYIQEATRANNDLNADYRALGGKTPGIVYGVSWTKFNEDTSDEDTVPYAGMQITSQNDKGFTAEITYPIAMNQAMPSENWKLTIGEADEDGNQTYTFQVNTPDMDEAEVNYGEFAKHRNDPMPPKPATVPIDTEETLDDDFGELLGGLAVHELLDHDFTNIDQLSLETWYLWRILKKSGLPIFTFKITMPGRITSHTIDGQSAGTLSADQRTLTLEMGDTFFTQYGQQAKQVIVTAEVNNCEAECKARPHMIWDQSAPGPGCTCICDNGYEPNDSGVCTTCTEICESYDIRAIHDPASSKPNSCGCSCPGTLMEFSWGVNKGDTHCDCVTGAEPKGNNACECKDGFKPNADGSKCLADAGNCPEGTNCLQFPDVCKCEEGSICDPLDKRGADELTGCTMKVAYIFISTEITPYDRLWIQDKINAIRKFFAANGYAVRTILVYEEGTQLIDVVGRPSTRAIAWFAHENEPALAHEPAGFLGRRVSATLSQQYRALGIPGIDAQNFTRSRQTLGLDYAYIHTCDSANDMSLRDYLVRPGGVYWGRKGILWATQDLTEYKGP